MLWAIKIKLARLYLPRLKKYAYLFSKMNQRIKRSWLLNLLFFIYTENVVFSHQMAKEDIYFCREKNTFSSSKNQI